MGTVSQPRWCNRVRGAKAATLAFAAAMYGMLIAGCDPIAVSPAGPSPVPTAPVTTSIPSAPNTTLSATPTAPAPTATDAPSLSGTPASPSDKAEVAGRTVFGEAPNGTPDTIEVNFYPRYPGTGQPRPTGSVLLWDGGDVNLIGEAELATDPLSENSSAIFTYDLSPGEHTLHARYLGDQNYQTLDIWNSIQIRNVEIAARVMGTPIDGRPFTIEIQVSPVLDTAGTPTGKVRNRADHGIASFEATLDGNGRATLVIEPTVAGVPAVAPRSAHITIEYLGAGPFLKTEVLVEYTVLPAPAT